VKATEDESEFLLDEYRSDDESEKTSGLKDVVGGGNMTSEVLKMLQQMAPTARTEQDGDEPDEIKVPPHKF
jgi:hypothetical protein